MGPVRSFSSAAVLLPAAIALTLAACGGGSGLALEDLEGATISATCEFVVRCKSEPDYATCVASEQSRESFVATMRTDIASGLVVYDGLAARRCVDDFGALRSCSAIAAGNTNKQLSAACGAVFKGTLPPGGPCFFNEECADQGTCDRPQCASSGGCCAGTCVAEPAPIPEGGDCTAATYACVDGTTCNVNPQGTSPQLVCVSVAGPRAACSSANLCTYPYACLTSNPASSTATCTAPAASGQLCRSDAVVSCDDQRESCDTATNRCTPDIAVGETCAPSSPVRCVGYASCQGTTCVPFGAAGASCDPATGASSICLGSLICDPATQLCTLPPKGASCR